MSSTPETTPPATPVPTSETSPTPAPATPNLELGATSATLALEPGATSATLALEPGTENRPPIQPQEYQRIIFLARFVVVLTVVCAGVLAVLAVSGANYLMLACSVMMIAAAVVYYLHTKRSLERDMHENPR